ncbi:MAG TPA: hypothetical protein VIO35_10660 [Chloroflexota bacterium]
MLDPVRHQLTNLLTGYGYNLYETKNRTRADDLLVREKAAECLAEAATTIRSLRTAYHRRFVPPPSRENPDPPPERMQHIREMARLQDRLGDLETRIRGMAVPSQDRVWEHLRSEKTLLNQLLLHDYNLIAPCQDLRTEVQRLTPTDWNDDVAASLDAFANQVERSVRSRSEFLRMPGS